jgi:hypothetical protein
LTTFRHWPESRWRRPFLSSKKEITVYDPRLEQEVLDQQRQLAALDEQMRAVQADSDVLSAQWTAVIARKDARIECIRRLDEDDDRPLTARSEADQMLAWLKDEAVAYRKKHNTIAARMRTLLAEQKALLLLQKDTQERLAASLQEALQQEEQLRREQDR